MFSTRAAFFEIAIQVKCYPGQIAQIFQQSKQREEDGHGRQHHRNHPGRRAVYPVYQQPVYVQPVSPLKGSNGVGVASFVMSMVSLVATIAVIAIISSIMDSVSSFYFSFSELQTLCTSGIVLAILALLVSIVGLILGIVGVARRNVKKGLALTGLIINGVELLADFVVIAMIAAIINELF